MVIRPDKGFIPGTREPGNPGTRYRASLWECHKIWTGTLQHVHTQARANAKTAATASTLKPMTSVTLTRVARNSQCLLRKCLQKSDGHWCHHNPDRSEEDHSPVAVSMRRLQTMLHFMKELFQWHSATPWRHSCVQNRLFKSHLHCSASTQSR